MNSSALVEGKEEVVPVEKSMTKEINKVGGKILRKKKIAEGSERKWTQKRFILFSTEKINFNFEKN